MFNEDTKVKLPTIIRLIRLAYQYLSLKEQNWDRDTNIFPNIFSTAISRFNKYYLYFVNEGYFDDAKAKTENTFTNMNKGDFNSINILQPSVQKLEIYHQIVVPLFHQINCQRLENFQLTQLRDWLLTLLIKRPGNSAII